MTSIFEYRGLIANFIKRDISQKYVGSLLGLYWSVVNPILTLVIYILVFGVFLKVRLPGDTDIWDFALYFAAGFLPWTAFQTSVMRAAGSIIDNKNYIKKVPFPSEIFPIYVTLSEFVNLLISLGIFFVLFVILKGIPKIFILLLPLAIILQVMFTFSLAFFLSSGSVYFRDIPQMLGTIFLIWFWMTPIGYTVNMIPASFHWIVTLNPVYYMLEIYRDALFYGKIPDLSILVPFTVFSVVLFIASIWFFRKTKRGFGELL
ncbi:MAG: ABC transporter permease [Methanoregula sp.]|jgi:ABC-type polysaccharide/polyol phosphate export permease|uniref:ABC transporter permease n=1 Tax=Methanoregula sp. TaxID=2052170 RepID=UPI003C2496E9